MFLFNLNSSLENIIQLKSDSHTVDGYYLKVGRIVHVTGMFTCKDATNDTIYINTPSACNVFSFTARDVNNGNIVTMWFNNSIISTYKHTGTMTVGNKYSFSFSFITYR